MICLSGYVEKRGIRELTNLSCNIVKNIDRQFDKPEFMLRNDLLRKFLRPLVECNDGLC